MIKLSAAIAGGFLAGAGAAVLLISHRVPDLELATILTEPTVNRVAQAADPTEQSNALTLAAIMSLPGDFEQTATLYQQLRRAGRDTLRRLITEADALPSTHEARAAKTIILARFAELDPEAAMEAALASSYRDDALGAVFRAWGKYDHDAALAYARGLPGRARRDAVVAILTVADHLDVGSKRRIAQSFSVLPMFEQMQAQQSAREDPAAAWYEALPADGTRSDGLRTQVLWEIARRWADTDPQQALAAVAALPKSGQRTTWLANLVGHWAENDRDAATAWALAQPLSHERARMLANVARILAEDSPRQGLEFAEALTGEARQLAITSAFNAWAQQDARAARHWLLSLPPSPNRTSMLAQSLRRLAETAPQEAVFLAGMLRGRERRTAMDAALRAWARDDVRAAANWVTRMGGRAAADRESHLGDVLSIWARDDALGAAAWIDASGLSSGAAVAAVAQHYAALDPQEALDWVLSQPLRIQRQAIWSVVHPWARDVPQSAVRAVERIRDADVRAGGQTAIASAWAEADPDRALRWAASLTDPDTRTRLSTQVLQRWVRFDAKGATAHVRTIRNAEERDAMTFTLVTGLMHEDPDLSEELYAKLTGTEIRQTAAVALYWFWRDRDPERANRYRAPAGA